MIMAVHAWACVCMCVCVCPCSGPATWWLLRLLVFPNQMIITSYFPNASVLSFPIAPHSFASFSRFVSIFLIFVPKTLIPFCSVSSGGFPPSPTPLFPLPTSLRTVILSLFQPPLCFWFPPQGLGSFYITWEQKEFFTWKVCQQCSALPVRAENTHWEYSSCKSLKKTLVVLSNNCSTTKMLRHCKTNFLLS